MNSDFQSSLLNPTLFSLTYYSPQTGFFQPKSQKFSKVFSNRLVFGISEALDAPSPFIPVNRQVSRLLSQADRSSTLTNLSR